MGNFHQLGFGAVLPPSDSFIIKVLWDLRPPCSSNCPIIPHLWLILYKSLRTLSIQPYSVLPLTAHVLSIPHRSCWGAPLPMRWWGGVDPVVTVGVCQKSAAGRGIGELCWSVQHVPDPISTVISDSRASAASLSFSHTLQQKRLLRRSQPAHMLHYTTLSLVLCCFSSLLCFSTIDSSKEQSL